MAGELETANKWEVAVRELVGTAEHTREAVRLAAPEQEVLALGVALMLCRKMMGKAHPD